MTDTDAAVRDTGYTGHAVSGAAWQGAVNVSIRVLRGVVFLVLARLVAPDAFGLIALATVFTLALQFVSGGGLSSAIVHVRDLTRSHLDTAFWTGTTVGLALSVLVAAASGTVAAWFGQPALGPVLLGLAVMPLLSGVSMVPEGVLSRELRFRALSLRHVAAAAVSVSLAVSLAVAGAGVWALVAQTVGEAVVSGVALWTAMRGRYRVGMRISRAALRDLVPFSGNVVGQNMTQLVSAHGDDFLVGLFLGPVALGLYSVAYRLLTIVQESMLNVSANVAFPLYSRLRHEPERLTAGFRRASRLIFAIAASVFLFLGLASSTVIGLALGPAWLPAAPAMALLAAAGIATTVIEVDNIYLQSIGRPGRAFALSVAGAALNLAGFLAVVRFGILWVAAAFTVRAFLFVPLSLWQAGRWAGGAGRLALAYLGLLPALTVVGLGAVALDTLAPAWGPVAALTVTLPATVALYLLALRLTAADVYADLSRLAATALPRTRRTS